MACRGNVIFVLFAGTLLATLINATMAQTTTQSSGLLGDQSLTGAVSNVLKELTPLIVQLLSGTVTSVSGVLQIVIKLLEVLLNSALLRNV